MRETRCIICGQRRNGLEVREDGILASLRWFKRNVTRNEQGYKLIVCRDCFEKHRKMRDKYNRRRITYTGIGMIFAAFLLITAPHSRILAAVFYGTLVVVFMYSLSLLSYTPGLTAHAPETAARPSRASSRGRRTRRRKR